MTTENVSRYCESGLETKSPLTGNHCSSTVSYNGPHTGRQFTFTEQFTICKNVQVHCLIDAHDIFELCFHAHFGFEIQTWVVWIQSQHSEPSCVTLGKLLNSHSFFIYKMEENGHTYLRVLWWGVNEINLAHKGSINLGSEILPFAATWMDLENITLSEISQSHRQIRYDLTYMWTLKNTINLWL